MTATVLVTPAELDAHELALEGEAYHHLFRTARLGCGDAVRAVDGRGRARAGVVARIERRRAWVRLGDAAPPREPRVELELLVAAPRPSRASWLVEKGTELGVRGFGFLHCERSQRPLDRDALDRLRRVARSAVEQCGRAWLPEVSAVGGLTEALAALDGASALLLDPEADAGPRRLAPGAGARLAVVVGPEGGFTAAELAAAQHLGASAMRLVPSVLRLETAALVAAAWVLLQGEVGPG